MTPYIALALGARTTVALVIVASVAHELAPAWPMRDDVERATAIEIVEVTLPQRIGGPGVMDVTLTGAADREPLFDALEGALVRRYADVLAPRALGAFAASGDPVAALVLAYLDDRRALPALRRWFVDAHDMYGWETSRPCPLDEGQHPARMAYEEALRSLTGADASAIRLRADQRAELVARAQSLDSDDALYVLARLSPADAFAVIARRFRAVRERHARFELALMLEHVIPLRTSSADVRRALGAPDGTRDGTVAYALTNLYDEPEELRLDVERGLVVRVTVDAPQ